MSTSNVAAVIPCFNSEKTISVVVSDVQKYLDNVIVVDDGSQDKSAQEAKRAGAKVVLLNKNSGVGIATKIGMQTAIDLEMDAVITLDSDGAHNPADIKKLLNAHFMQNNELTIGNRWKRYNKTLPSSKWWANQFAACLINKISDTSLPDVACGFRVFSSKLLRSLLMVDLSKGFGFIYQSIFLAKQYGGIGYTDIDVRYDANFLFATKKKELEHLLETSSQYCQDSQLSLSIKHITKEVFKLNKVQLRLNIDGVFEYIILYPLKKEEAFVFQRQHPKFVINKLDFINL